MAVCLLRANPAEPSLELGRVTDPTKAGWSRHHSAVYPSIPACVVPQDASPRPPTAIRLAWRLASSLLPDPHPILWREAHGISYRCCAGPQREAVRFRHGLTSGTSAPRVLRAGPYNAKGRTAGRRPRDPVTAVPLGSGPAQHGIGIRANAGGGLRLDFRWCARRGHVSGRGVRMLVGACRRLVRP